MLRDSAEAIAVMNDTECGTGATTPMTAIVASCTMARVTATDLDAPRIDAACTDATAGDATESEIIGRIHRLPLRYEVSREKIREFATAVLDAHPAHRDEAAAAGLGHAALVASPTFLAVLAGHTQQYLFDNVLVGFDLSQVMQADQRFSFARPVVAGDVLSTDVAVESVRRMAGSSMFTIRNDFRDEAERLVARSWTTLVGRDGVEVDPAIAEFVRGVMRVEV
ncbi:Acyl dehydratase [Rhodococcus triatomae]|uniref:UPF0336 protein SAMN05444695_101450 n=1 Tax=Rhodococcus triatomae TaxID=300028 RepID=A0A1G8AJR1_9NOCA|nr:Acyl dehydratase [Rhodococcus triatomae]